MALIAIDGAASFAIDDVTGKLHVIDLAGNSVAEIDFNVMVSGGVNFKGGYDANTNTPDLDSTPIAITKGDMYVVTANGNFFTEAVQVGDALIADIDSAAVLTDWTILEGNDQAIKQAIKDHVVRTASNWKTAETDVIANPRKFLNVFRVDKNITLTSADKSSGKVEGDIWFIVKTDFETTRPKITDNKYSMAVKCSQLRWTGIDYLMDGDDNGIFFTGEADISTMYDFSNCDISRNANFPFIDIVNDSYGGITFNRVTGTDTSTTTGKVNLNQNTSGTDKAITDVNVINGCNFSGVFASADGTVGELNVYVSGGSVISNNGNGVWNATNGATINVIMTPDCQVSRDLVAGSSAVTFTVVGKAEDWSFFISDQDSDLTINTAITFPATKKRRLVEADIPSVTVKVAPTGSTATFDIVVGGVSVLSTVISIDAGQKTSVTAATSAVLDATKTLINIGDLVELKILTVGSTIAGTGAKMNIPNLIEA